MNSATNTIKKRLILTFVTGNVNKLKEVNQMLPSNIKLINKKIDLPELQGDVLDIIKEKTRMAYDHIKGPVLVEDTSLCFNALNGLPGPYIKWFLKSIGHIGLNNLLNAYIDKTAYAQCIFGLKIDEKSDIQLFIGQCPGEIVLPRGPNTFGWDPIFLPNNKEKTFAEMSSIEKNKISHRSIALNKLCQYLSK